MKEFSNFKTGSKELVATGFETRESSNPLSATNSDQDLAISNYSQSFPRKTYDDDMAKILEIVRIINNLAPRKMPVYSFNLNEINGERFYKPDGTMLLVREYESDVIRDYYISKVDPNSIEKILEHNKTTGRLKVKIEPNLRPGSRTKVNLTIFDEKINKKYTIMQIGEDGVVNNISEFSGKGKSFQTLFRNVLNFKPARYLEGKDTLTNGFEMVDCIFDNDGNIARIKKYNNKREVNIEYTDDRKIISVKTK